MGDDRRRDQRGDARGGGPSGARTRGPPLSAASPARRPLGASIPLAGRPLAAQGALLGRLSDAGYTDLWTQETDAYDAFTPLAFAAAHAPRLGLGTAIASHAVRGPLLLAQQAAALADAAPGRFVLGLGPSSRPIVAGWNGWSADRPLARTRDVLRFLRRVFAGGRVDFEGQTFRCRGARLERPPAAPPPIHLAALGPGMLALAAREADGVLLSLVAAEDLPRLRAELAAADPRGAALPLAMRIGVMVDEDPAVARAHARRLIAGYLTVDRYAALHARLGRAAALGPMRRAWRAGDRRGARAAVPDALVDALFLVGDVDACRRGLARFRRAGLDHPIVSLMRCRGDPVAILEALAVPTDA